MQVKPPLLKYIDKKLDDAHIDHAVVHSATMLNDRAVILQVWDSNIRIRIDVPAGLR
jgi:hypothetical protein